jgi:transaldolase
VVYLKHPRIVLDTANIEKLNIAVSTGIVDGISTNPNRVEESGRSYN